jgi:hypothetical protein
MGTLPATQRLALVMELVARDMPDEAPLRLTDAERRFVTDVQAM